MRSVPAWILILTLVQITSAGEVPAAGEAPAAALPPIERFLEIRGQAGGAISPDGGTIAYLDRVTGVAEAWMVPATGGWPEQLTFFGERVASISWSPHDRRHVVVERDLAGTERRQLFLIDPQGGMPVRLTHDDGSVYGVGGFSPDGHTMALRTNQRDPAHFDVHLLDLVTRASRPLVERDQFLFPGRFSPDGTKLLVTRAIGPDQNQLLLVDVATGEVTALTAESPPARHSAPHWAADGKSVLLLSDRGRDNMTLARLDIATHELRFLRQDRMDAETIAVSANGRYLALVLNVNGLSEVVLLDLGRGEAPVLESSPDLPVGVILGLDWTPDGSRLAVTMATSRSPGTVYVYDRVRRVLTQVTRPALAGVQQEMMVDPTVVSYPSFDGRTITGLLYRPREPASNPPPCVVLAHGGPTSQSRPGFSAMTQYFTSRGCVVFKPNVRGSSGYGRAFRALDDRDKREDSVADLERGVVHLARAGEIDSTRVGVYGASYGGYVVLAALTLYPQRFACGVDQVGIANFVTFLENTASYRRPHRELEYGSLETDRELLERLSPLGRVDRIRAPLLVIHGANDPRVPVGEAEQIVAALKARGLAVEFLRFEDEGHGVARRENRIRAYGTVARFLCAHLGLPVDPPAEAPPSKKDEGSEGEE